MITLNEADTELLTYCHEHFQAPNSVYQQHVVRLDDLAKSVVWQVRIWSAATAKIEGAKRVDLARAADLILESMFDEALPAVMWSYLSAAVKAQMAR